MDEAQFETRIIRKFIGIKAATATDSTGAMILTLVGQTDTGPLDVRITQIAAQELLAVLSTHPQVRGSA
jgi:hypothetical protein